MRRSRTYTHTYTYYCCFCYYTQTDRGATSIDNIDEYTCFIYCPQPYYEIGVARDRDRRVVNQHEVSRRLWPEYNATLKVMCIIIWPKARERSGWSNEITWPDLVKKVVGRY